MSEQAPIPMILHCPECGKRHIDEGEFATKVHTSHSCQHCGITWRPAIVPTVGVQFLPGFKNATAPKPICDLCGVEGQPFMVPRGWHHHSLRSEREEMWPTLCPRCGNLKPVEEKTDA